MWFVNCAYQAIGSLDYIRDSIGAIRDVASWGLNVVNRFVQVAPDKQSSTVKKAAIFTYEVFAAPVKSAMRFSSAYKCAEEAPEIFQNAGMVYRNGFRQFSYDPLISLTSNGMVALGALHLLRKGRTWIGPSLIAAGALTKVSRLAWKMRHDETLRAQTERKLRKSEVEKESKKLLQEYSSQSSVSTAFQRMDVLLKHLGIQSRRDIIRLQAIPEELKNDEIFKRYTCYFTKKLIRIPSRISIDGKDHFCEKAVLEKAIEERPTFRFACQIIAWVDWTAAREIELRLASHFEVPIHPASGRWFDYASKMYQLFIRSQAEWCAHANNQIAKASQFYDANHMKDQFVACAGPIALKLGLLSETINQAALLTLIRFNTYFLNAEDRERQLQFYPQLFNNK